MPPVLAYFQSQYWYLTISSDLNLTTYIYNALTLHGLTERDELPASVLDIQQFWKITAYQIGDDVFSLDDLEHGILRGKVLVLAPCTCK